MKRSLPKSGTASSAAPLFVWRSRNADYPEITDSTIYGKTMKTGLREPMILKKRIHA